MLMRLLSWIIAFREMVYWQGIFQDLENKPRRLEYSQISWFL